MSQVTASCGHVLTEEEGDGQEAFVRISDEYEDPEVDHMVLCNACYDMYSKAGILMSQKQADRFMRSNSRRNKHRRGGRDDFE